MRKSLKIIGVKALPLVVVMFLSKISFAQNKNISYGAKGGINFSKFTESNLNKETKFRLGYQLGGIVDFPLMKRFHVQTELFYSETGSKSLVDVLIADPATGFFTVDQDVQINLKYVNLPVLAKYYITNQFSFEIGPQIAYLLSGKLVYAESVFNNNSSEEGRTISLTNYEKFDISIKLGLTYKHTTGFFLNMNYNYGLINLITSNIIVPANQNNYNLSGENEVLKNRGVFVSLGYFFN